MSIERFGGPPPGPEQEKAAEGQAEKGVTPERAAETEQKLQRIRARMEQEAKGYFFVKVFDACEGALRKVLNEPPSGLAEHVDFEHCKVLMLDEMQRFIDILKPYGIRARRETGYVPPPPREVLSIWRERGFE